MKIYAITNKRLNLRFGNFKSIFQRRNFLLVVTFFRCLYFSVLVDIRINTFKHISLLDFNILSFPIWRSKHKSIESSHLKPPPQNSESQSCFQTSKKPLNDGFGPKWIRSLKVSKNEE